MRRKIKHGLYLDWNKASFRGIFAWFFYGLIILRLVEAIFKLCL